MASFSTFLRRVAFLGLITIQSILLSAYLAKYDGKYIIMLGDRISKTEFLSPNVFKAILCITPLLLLLLPNTGDLDDSHENHKETEIVFLFVVAHDHRSVR
ncbi:uncharacterized protein LOC113673547 [Pocillopora damicornis]|uniref:uncharacterized protein LOC113673547 n=1 Tax=Pocillopora damicornis TaxID=46731 RepID=UPI000F55635C|nr:uncharacterized protein LOC113673547 [Pocillopora damicornis]